MIPWDIINQNIKKKISEIFWFSVYSLYRSLKHIPLDTSFFIIQLGKQYMTIQNTFKPKQYFHWSRWSTSHFWWNLPPSLERLWRSSVWPPATLFISICTILRHKPIPLVYISTNKLITFEKCPICLHISVFYFFSFYCDCCFRQIIIYTFI